MSDDLKRMEEGLERHLNEARSGLADTSTLPELRTTRRRTEELPKMDEIAAQDADMAEEASGGMRVRRRGNSGSRAAKRPRTAGRSGQKKQSGVAKRTGASKCSDHVTAHALMTWLSCTDHVTAHALMTWLFGH